MRNRSMSLVLAIFLLCPYVVAQWVKTNGPNGSVSSLALSGTNLFAGTWGGVFLSTNNGTNWTAVNTGLTNTSVVALAVSGSNLFAGTWTEGVFLSTNDGASWTAADSGMTGGGHNYVIVLAVSGTNVFVGTEDGGVFRSSNNGTSWTAVNGGLPTRFDVSSLAVSGTNLFAGTSFTIMSEGGGVFLSTNSSSSWTAVNTGLTDTNVTALAIFGTNLFAGTLGGSIFRSSNNGTSWSAANTPFLGFSCMTQIGSNLFAGTSSGVYFSSNSGTTWTAVNTGLTDTSVSALVVLGTYLFAGTGSGVWRRPLSEMITSVGLPSKDLPAEFNLKQNYPNPFNPSTTIEFGLPRTSQVNLSVYDILGREVSVLVNQKKEAGTCTVVFDASDLASGSYFYRLQAGGYVQTRRMLVVR